MGVLLMLLTIGGLGVAFLLMIVAGVTRAAWLAKFIFGAVGVWFAVYAVMLVTISLASEEKILGLNEPKAFCGFYLDCHLRASISEVRKTKIIGNKTAVGEFYLVRVKVSSDARRAELNLWNPQFVVKDAQGRQFERIVELEKNDSSWEQKVPAGGVFEKEIVFDLPADAENPRLDIAEGISGGKVIESFLIGDEDSIFHERVWFDVEPKAQTAKF